MNQYLLSGFAGSVSILASLFLVFELAGTPLIGSDANAPSYGRVVLIGLVVVASAIASMKFHRQSNLDPTRRPSHRLHLVEGILFTFVGGLMLAGAFLWLHLSGGAYGLHFIGIILGGGLTLEGLRKLRAGH